MAAVEARLAPQFEAGEVDEGDVISEQLEAGLFTLQVGGRMASRRGGGRPRPEWERGDGCAGAALLVRAQVDSLGPKQAQGARRRLACRRLPPL